MGYLLAIAVGPVQDFIAAARRTRDLWFGSFLLSEISKAVAKCLASKPGVVLIFPNPDTLEKLNPNGAFNVANIILAEVTVLEDTEEPYPNRLQSDAKAAAAQRWESFCAEAMSISEVAANVRGDLWKQQVQDVVEFYAAWLPYAGPSEYKVKRADLMRLLAGRKACRDFACFEGHPLIPKSSLDGARESVLKKEKNTRFPPRRRLRLNPGEELDAIGVVKRVAGEKRQYPSVSRVAADGWLRGLPDVDVCQLRKECAALTAEGLAQLNDERFKNYARFPYEGAAVYKNRVKEITCEEDEPDPKLNPLRQVLAAITARNGEPDAYFAVLAADGDFMGRAIAGMDTPDQHRAFSRILADFAGAAEKVVRDSQGSLVYAGGDDVLAFLPVDRALGCARELRQEFCSVLKQWGLTFSVGIAFGHSMEPLEDLLDAARDAERHAKRPRAEAGDWPGSIERDALAVHWHSRGAEPVQLRDNWDSKPVERLAMEAAWIEAGWVSTKAAYGLRQLAAHYSGWPEEKHAEMESALRCEALCMLKHKIPAEHGETAKQLEDMIHRRGSTPSALLRLAEELIVAGKIGDASSKARPSDQNRGDV